MHELSIAQAVVRETEKRLREGGVRPASARVVRVLVGDLSGTDARALEEAFRALLPATALAGARAEVKRDPARVVCPACGVVEAGEPFRIECPKCGGEPERIEGGRDVTVESVEVDDET
ncbi:MAG: hydrogenase maturation nickel metallochaperone HypA/HybF [Planctomycetota bacterium]|jgi:hydrogenase nickel insertion protein HypA